MKTPSSVERVPRHSPRAANAAIWRRIEASLLYYAQRPEAIEARLHELDREWDIERVLEANAATLATVGAVLGVVAHRRFALVPAVVGAFLLQHAVQGWCPPVEVFRRLQIRTPQEIEAERYGLKAVRGDFGEVPAGTAGVDAALRAIGRWRADGGEPPSPAPSDGRGRDVERVIRAEAPLTTLLGLALRLSVSRRLLAGPIVAQTVLLLHTAPGVVSAAPAPPSAE